MNKKKKILIFTNDHKNVLNLRIDLINFLKKFYDVKILIIDKKLKQLQNLHSLNKKYKSFNLLNDISLLMQIFNFFRKKKPDLIINFTLKPSIYGSMISCLLGIKSITVVTGLGSIYLNNYSKMFYLFIMKFIFYINSFVIFQNKFDKKIFYKSNHKSKIIYGSGFNKKIFKYKKKIKNNNFKFLMVSRLLKDKGVIEYLQAAKQLKKQYSNKISFCLMFSSDKSFFGISTKYIYKYKKFIKFFNFSKKNYKNQLNRADCFVLPSYREGFSKTLLEASSNGNVVLSTNVPGCKDIIIHKKTGFLCQPKSVNSLRSYMKHIYLLSQKQRDIISLSASLLVNKKFSCDKINQDYLNVIKKII